MHSIDAQGRASCIRKTILSLTAVLFCVELVAFVTPPAQVIPSNPTSADRIRVRIPYAAFCLVTTTTVISGALIRVDVTPTSCTGIPGSQTIDVEFGPLAAGTYTLEVYDVGTGTPDLRIQQALVVAEAAIPALSPVAMAVLAITLAAAGWCALTLTR